MTASEDLQGQEIAIVGMAGRFPGADSPEALWDRLVAGEECIRFFTPEELAAAGLPRELVERSDYVPAAGWLEGHDRFDPEFFDMTPREAQITDPQLRLFLECAWQAFENGGYVPGETRGRTGVFATASASPYLWVLQQDRELVRALGGYRLRLGNEKDFLPTWVSYKLGLEGPSLNVQTACSSSLVAVHLACQSLLAQECDLALAGGVSVRHLRPGGYLHQEGAVTSPDGHCRAFDADAAGTVAGDGIGVVLLKRLDEALEDGDVIHAVIRGSAINNDGAAKVGYTAPSQKGQARVIREALSVAGVHPEEVGYVEAHGTGTPLGDPIEVAALTEAFGTRRRGFCALGSVKTNLGHLDAAAGIAGLIKAVLALTHETIPASLHFRSPNPRIGFADSPFVPSAERTPWPRGAAPRYAGVSAFGIGGTNAHAVLEEAPRAAARSGREAGEDQLVVLSARSEAALDAATLRLAAHLRRHPELDLADVAWTTQTGRRRFEFRRTVVGRDAAEVAAGLESLDPRLLPTTEADPGADPAVAFLFPGQGAQHPGMGRALYRRWPVFRETIDRCAAVLAKEASLDLLRLIDPPAGEAAPEQELIRTAVAQPALFAVEYALARLWMSLGCRPEAMLGHSLGEYVAACLAGVFSLEDALRLVAARGRLMQRMPPGSMLAVELSEKELLARMAGWDLALAAVNAPDRTTVSGPEAAIERFAAHLEAAGVACRRLHTSHAFHSPGMAPAAAAFAEVVAGCTLCAPEIPFLSSLTGRWITAAEATDPAYWARQIVEPVRVSPAFSELLRHKGRVLLEVGPGQGMTVLARRHGEDSGPATALASLARSTEEDSGRPFLAALGGLWRAGVRIDWAAVHGRGQRRRVSLPTYPFERRRFAPGGEATAPSASEREPSARWLYAPSWRSLPAVPRSALEELAGQRGLWLLLADEWGWGDHLAERLRGLGQRAVLVTPGEVFARGYQDLLREAAADGPLAGVVHLWSLSPVSPDAPAAARFDEQQRLGFYTVASLVQAWLAQHAGAPLRLLVVANGLEPVLGDEPLAPEKTTLLGLSKVISQEGAGIACQCVDVAPRDLSDAGERSRTVEQILGELAAPLPESVVALRGARRWLKTFAPLPAGEVVPRLRPGGVYLITGGLGRVGLALAEHLARTARAKLVLTRRSPLPPREERDHRLATALLAIEAAGGEVEAVAADVTDREAMLRVLALTEARFGRLDGVIHAAGLIGAAAVRPLEEMSPEDCERHFDPKVRGLLVLDELLRDRPLDFRLLTSSLASVLGGLGFAAYAAANCYLDAFAACSRPAAGFGWTSVSWDAWRFQDTSGDSREPALTPREGGDVLDRVLALEDPVHVAVSTTDLERRRETWTRLPAAGDPARTPPKASGDVPAGDLRNDLERAVASVWRDLLGVETLDREDNFFDLGGDSLLATQVVSRLRAGHRISLPLRAVFEAPTIAALAARLTAARDAAAGEAPPLFRRQAGEVVPLSFSQQRLWFLDQLERDAHPYNTLSAFRVAGELDVPALAASFSAIVARHEALRTVFPTVDGSPVQEILPAAPVPLPVVDLAALPEPMRMSETHRLARDEARRAYRLDRGPLCRNTLLRLNARDHVVFIAAHHIVLDGWSVGVFRRELSELYAACREQRAPELPGLRLQYADYAVWQRKWLQGEAFDRQLDFWRRQLSALPVLELPFDHPRPARSRFRGGAETMRFGRELTTALQALSKRHDATLFMTLLTAFKILLCRVTGQEDVVVGSNVANRSHAELEGLIGFFVNNLVLRTDLSGDPSAREALERVRDATLASFAHQEVPFDRLVEDLQPERTAGRNPLFQVLFVLQIAARESPGFSGLELTSLKLDRDTAAFDMLFNLQEHPDGLFGSLEYDSDLFDPETVRDLLERYRMLLEALVADPEVPISRLSLVSEQVEAALVAGFTDSFEDGF